MNAVSNAAVNNPAAPLSPAKKWVLWTGRALSVLPILGMVASASMKLSRQPQMAEQFSGKLGYPAGTLLGIGLVELACVVLYAIPRTAVLGAILLTGYLGGAVATHVRIGEAFAPPIVLGILVWAGLFLRDGRLQALLPLRKSQDA